MSQQTYNDLIDAAKNTNAIQDDTDKLVESRYAAVIASAKRARQIIDGADPVLPNAEGRKPLAISFLRNFCPSRRCWGVSVGRS